MDEALYQPIYQQLEQERLLNQVTTQIRQSLDLPVILSTAVEQMQRLLQVDRMVIYQFDFRWSVPPAQCSLKEAWETEQDEKLFLPVVPALSVSPSHIGSVTYEARSSNRIPSVMHLSEAAGCYGKVFNQTELPAKGFIRVVEDIENDYQGEPCLLEFLKQVQVRAKVVLSILVQGELWGLLIAHQCFEPRHWQDHEVKFLSQITEHLSIAIYQAQLYTQVQQQKATLENRVKERTQALQDALLAAQSASRAKSEFLAIVSHELRTPLTAVIGISATLLRYFSDGSTRQQIPPEKQKSYLQIIHDSGEHLLGLINDILDLSQVEAGKTILQISRFSLTKLANQCLHTFREKAIQGRVHLAGEFQIDPAREYFFADQRRVRQIVLNLLSNAIKFTPAGGRVILKVFARSKMVIFQVEDTGIGISEDQKSLLFEKFQQLGSPYQRQYGGTGLGLALTRQLVELHSGVIQFDSRIGQGSIFTVHLPDQRLESGNSKPGRGTRTAFPTPQQTMDSEPDPCRLVIIEDDEATAILMCELLMATGYQVVWLVEGLTALQQIDLLQPGIVIIDMDLPGRESNEIIRQLKTVKAMHRARILALADQPMSAYPQELYNVPDQWLAKPIDPNRILEAVASLGAINLKPDPKNISANVSASD
ncbi:MAG: GAF domain-containing protein [Oscillatoriales cyanobacterium RM2_1_1]|nr:GAF domain-containing protein [Oscillatoriales cyanobacterium RM2_1_1]